jgi:hypothetical protein
MPALNENLPLLRAFMRTLHLLDPPDDLMKKPEVIQAVLASYARREERARDKQAEGPSREAMVALFAEAV